VTPLCVVSTFS